MLRKKAILGIVVVALVGLVLASQTLSQPGQRGGQRGGQQQVQRGQRGGQQGGPGGRGQFDPAQFRQRMDQMLRERLGATEQEWKVLGPRVNKVMELSRESRGGGMFGGRGSFGGRGGFGTRGGGPGGDRPGAPGGGRPGAPAREQTAVEKAQEQLRTLVFDNTESTPEQIKGALTTLRKEREAAKQKLAAAQQDLRKIVTIRQEAVCVIMGWLD